MMNSETCCVRGRLKDSRVKRSRKAKEIQAGSSKRALGIICSKIIVEIIKIVKRKWGKWKED